MKLLSSLTIVLALLTGAVACGGSSSNAALKRRINYEHLAPMPAAERSQEADAYKQVFLAEWQIAFTKSQLDAAELEVKLTKNDLASATISVKSAGIEMKAAEDTGDLNKIAESQKSERVANLEIDLHKIRNERAKKNVAYLKKRLTYEERTHRSREAELENVRAASLKSAGIQPPNFDASKYKAQLQDRQAQAKAVEVEVTALQKEVLALDAQVATAANAIATTKASKVQAPEVGPAAPMEPLAPIEPVLPDEPSEPADPGPKESAPAESAPAKPSEPAPPASKVSPPTASASESTPAPAPKDN